MMDESYARQKLQQMGYTNIYRWCDPPGTYYDWHFHDDDEVRFVISGDITIWTEEKVYNLKEGDMLEVKAGIKHRAKTEQGVCYLCGSR